MNDDLSIEKLAALSRISVSKEEAEALKKDIASILSYVDQISEVSGDIEREIPEHRNIMREDGEPHETGIYTEALLKAAPRVKDEYIEVKKIISQE